MPQFYTLEEASRLLGMSQDELKKMAERNEVRAFRDRGTMRFRGPEIDELARRRGPGSDPDLKLAEKAAKPPSPRPQKSPTPAAKSPPPKPKTPSPTPAKGGDAGVFDFPLSGEDSDQVEIGQELRLESASGSHKGGSGKGGPRKPGSTKSPSPKPGSDSDVRLVPDGSDLDFQVANDSDVKMVDEPAPKPASTPPKRKGGPPSSKSRLDSGPQVVPLEGQPDSDVKVLDSDPKVVEPPADSGVALGKTPPKAASDSDIRLDDLGRVPKKPGSGKKVAEESQLSDEIDLDAELRQAEEAQKGKPPKRKSKAKPPAQPQLPTTSPFELSEADLDVKPAGALPSAEDSSSDFDLTPAAGQESSAVDLSSSEEIPAQAASDDEVDLGELTASKDRSGINLRDPADSGISLEQGASGDDMEFELSTESTSPAPKPKTPKPSTPKPTPTSDLDSDSEFELSLDESSSEEQAAASSPTEDSDSEFELSLDAESDLEPGSSPVEAGSSPVDSDSEFELTLDDSGGLAVEGEGEGDSASGEKDIFETDFEVPSLEDESGSQAVALDESDSDVDSSDFDLALDEGDAAAEEESGSQVVALEDEEAAAEGAPARPRRRGAPVLEEDSEEVEDLFGEEGEEEAAAAGAARGAAVAAPPAEWGPLPTIVLLICLVPMLLGTFMSYELIRRDGTNNPNMITKAIGGIFLGNEVSK